MTLAGGRDVAVWLSKKLESAWSAEDFAYLVSEEILVAIAKKFSTLETQVKLGLLFSFVAIRKQVLHDLTGPIREILDLAAQDEEEWVRVCAQELADILSSKPHINVKIDNARNKTSYNELVKTSK